jgi:hypothetical protein
MISSATVEVAAPAPAAGVSAAGAGWAQTTAAPASPANTDYTQKWLSPLSGTQRNQRALRQHVACA